MAQQKGIVKIKGTVGDLTFYKSKDGFLVREKSDLDGDRIASDPAFARTRENNKEFAASASASKMLRRSINPLMKNASDGRVSSRLNKLMSVIKNMDTTSVRGSRNVPVSIAAATSKAQLNGFNFNKDAPLDAVLKQAFTVNTATGLISIANLTPANDLEIPEGASHVNLTGAWVKLDFGTGIYDLQMSPLLTLPINNVANPVALTPAAVPAGTGTDIFLLLVEFSQLVNLIQYPLNNGKNNALSIVDVA